MKPVLVFLSIAAVGLALILMSHPKVSDLKCDVLGCWVQIQR